MTDNTSATGGILLPAGGEIVFVGSGEIVFEGAGPISWAGVAPPAPLDDDALDDFFQALVRDVTGLSGSLVRPRYQPEPPAIPDQSVDWAAIGLIGERQRDPFVAVEHDPAGEGWDRVTRHETLPLLCSFYGPNAQGYATALADGLMVAQNREGLYLADMVLDDTGPVTRAPELVQKRWLNRADLPITIRRRVVRYYPVLSLVSAVAALTAPPVSQTITVS